MTGAWPTGFLVRRILEECPNFSAAVSQFSRCRLMAPVYFTIAGVASGEGCVLSRSQGKNLRMWDLRDMGPCVQTNMDWWNLEDPDKEWQNVAASRRRHGFARASLKFLEVTNVMTFDRLWALVVTPPVKASDTIYTVSMSAASDEYTTRIEIPHWLVRQGEALKAEVNQWSSA